MKFVRVRNGLGFGTPHYSDCVNFWLPGLIQYDRELDPDLYGWYFNWHTRPLFELLAALIFKQV